MEKGTRVLLLPDATGTRESGTIHEEYELQEWYKIKTKLYGWSYEKCLDFWSSKGPVFKVKIDFHPVFGENSIIEKSMSQLEVMSPEEIEKRNASSRADDTEQPPVIHPFSLEQERLCELLLEHTADTKTIKKGEG